MSASTTTATEPKPSAACNRFLQAEQKEHVHQGKWSRLSLLLSFFTDEVQKSEEEQEEEDSKEPTRFVSDEMCEIALRQFAITSLINAYNAENDMEITFYGKSILHARVVDSLFPQTYYLQLSEELSAALLSGSEQEAAMARAAVFDEFDMEFITSLKAQRPLLHTFCDYERRFTFHAKTKTIYHNVEAQEAINPGEVEFKRALRYVNDQDPIITFFTIIGGPFIRNLLLLKVTPDVSSVVEFLGTGTSSKEHSQKTKLPSADQKPAKGSASTSGAGEAKGESNVCLEKSEAKAVCCTIDIEPLERRYVNLEKLDGDSRARIYYNLGVHEERECMMKTCRAIQSQIMLMAEPNMKRVLSEDHAYVEPLLGFSDIILKSLKHSKKSQVVRITLVLPQKKLVSRILKQRFEGKLAAKEVENFKMLERTSMVPKVYHHDRSFELLSDCGDPLSLSEAKQFMMKILDFVEQVHDMEYVIFDLKLSNFCYLKQKKSLYMVALEFLSHTSVTLETRVCPGTKGYTCFKLKEDCLNENGYKPHKGYDIFSLGVMLMEHLLEECEDREVALYLEGLSKGKTTTNPPTWEHELSPMASIIASCFDPVLDKRPPVSLLKQQLKPYFGV